MADNNFNRADLRMAPDIDLIRRAEMRKRREELEAARAADPWAGVAIDVNQIPNSALYEIFRNESINHAQTAQLLMQAHNLNNAEMLAQILNIDFGGGAIPSGFKQLAPAIAQANASMQAAAAQQKATLALAAATMASRDGHAPRWYADDGSLTGECYAAKYLARKLAERPQDPEPVVDLAASGD